MKRLFTVVKNTNDGQREHIRIENQMPPYFDDKMEAKRIRDLLNENETIDKAGGNVDADYDIEMVYTIAHGPDHWKY